MGISNMGESMQNNDLVGRTRWIGFAVCLFAASTAILAGAFPVEEPQPGDIFREHICIDTTGVEPNNWIRVQIRNGNAQGATIRRFRGEVDLDGATKAQIRIQKLLCHDDTEGLAIIVNNKPAIVFPESKLIPAPASAYQHMTYPIVEVPLSYLKPGANTFTMKVDRDHAWNYPQNIIYGVTLMVFYGSSKPHPTGTMASPATGSALGMSTQLKANVTPAGSPIARVDYIGHYEDYNYEGDGEYRQWHYHYLRDKMSHHLASRTRAPYTAGWNTYWVPDQDQPIKIAARIIDETGMVYITPPVEGLTLERPGVNVKMYRPYDVPKVWVTRKAEYHSHFDIPQTADLTKISSVRLMWTSWSAYYSAGILVNGTKVIPKPSPAAHYDYAFHSISIPGDVLKKGQNTITTEQKQFIDGVKVHGMEVMWPGMVPFVRYKDKSSVRNGSDGSLSALTVRHNSHGMFLDLSGSGYATVGIYNASGQQVYSNNGETGARVGIDLGGLRQGVYLMRVKSDGRTFQKKFCVMR